MIKKLSELKKDIIPGMKIELIKVLERDAEKKVFKEIVISEKRKIRTVTVVNSVGFYLADDETYLKFKQSPRTDESRGNFSDWPKKMQLTYLDDVFTIDEIDEIDDKKEIWQTRIYKILK